jgi:sugar phosphate isomerase/epimerase
MAMIHWRRNEPLEETVERLCRCGYDALEINGAPDRYDGAAVAELLGRHDLAMWGAVTLTEHAGRDMLHPDPHGRRGAQAYLEDTVDPICTVTEVWTTDTPVAASRRGPLEHVQRRCRGLRRRHLHRVSSSL